jgi:hypothetical protein
MPPPHRNVQDRGQIHGTDSCQGTTAPGFVKNGYQRLHTSPPPPYFLAPAQVARGFSPFTADTSFGLPFWTRVIYLGGSLGFPAVRHLAHRQSCNLYTRLGRLHNTFSASVLGNGFQYQNLVWYGMASSSRYFHLAS